jgi:hypothetical protein
MRGRNFRGKEAMATGGISKKDCSAFGGRFAPEESGIEKVRKSRIKPEEAQRITIKITTRK